MQTYSHLLLTAAMQQPLQKRGIAVNLKAMLLGSVLPDLPFFLLTALFGLYYTWFAPTPTGEGPLIYMHMTLYFKDPLWIISQNFFHAPFIIAGLAMIGYLGLRQQKPWGSWLFWLAFAAGFHVVLDILTHNKDGPLLLFPFNWQYRFHSPISYWDFQHYGLFFTIFEHLLDVGLIAYLLKLWQQHRLTTLQLNSPGRIDHD